jgi:hypothetical protein
MSLNETHSRIKSRIWKEIARAKIDINQLEQETVETLVNLATEAALLEMDEVMAQSVAEEKVASRTSDHMPDQSIFDDQKRMCCGKGGRFCLLSSSTLSLTSVSVLQKGFWAKAVTILNWCGYKI